MWRILIFFLVALPLAQAQEEAAPAAPFDAQIGSLDYRQDVTVYYSMSCAHCLDFLDRNLARLAAQARAGHAKLTLIEAPGYVAEVDEKFYGYDTKGVFASNAMRCVAATGDAEAYIDALLAAISIAKAAVKPDPERTDWQNGNITWQHWVHASGKTLNDGFVHGYMYEAIMASAGLSYDDCDKAGFNAFRAERQRILRDDIKRGVPYIVYNGAGTSSTRSDLPDTIQETVDGWASLFQSHLAIKLKGSGDRVIVDQVTPNGRGARLDLKPGDHLVSLGFEPLSRISDLAGRSGKTGLLEVASGEALRYVQLADAAR